MSEGREYQFRLPDIGEGIAEAEIVAWHVSVGDLVEEDDPLADVMTDKATVEMTAPVTGVIRSFGGGIGEMVPIGSVLAVFEVAVEAAPAAHDPVVGGDAELQRANRYPQLSGEPVDAVTVQARIGADEAQMATPHADPQRTETPPAEVDRQHERRILASPAVRQRARTLGVDLADVKVPQGERVRHSDLDTFISYNEGTGYGIAHTARPDEHVRVIGLRRRIAENMAAAKRNIPHFTYVESFDVTKLEAMRADLNASRGTRPKLTLLPFLIVAICRIVPEYPMMNARYDDEAGIVTRHGSVHMGIAVQTDAGLLVPVVRNANQRNVWQLAEEIRRLADEARAGRSPIADLANSTMTITSLGNLGGIATTPVINRPEVAIVGPNKIVESVVVTNGEMSVAKLMNVSISCDHRVVDGWDAASFAQALRRLIETPSSIFAI